MLAELCKTWPDRWDEYVAPACRIKRTLLDSSLPSKMTSFEFLFGRKPRAPLDSLVPLLNDTKQPDDLDNLWNKENITI